MKPSSTHNPFLGKEFCPPREFKYSTETPKFVTELQTDGREILHEKVRFGDALKLAIYVLYSEREMRLLPGSSLVMNDDDNWKYFLAEYLLENGKWKIKSTGFASCFYGRKWLRSKYNKF